MNVNVNVALLSYSCVWRLHRRLLDATSAAVGKVGEGKRRCAAVLSCTASADRKYADRRVSRLGTKPRWQMAPEIADLVLAPESFPQSLSPSIPQSLNPSRKASSLATHSHTPILPILPILPPLPPSIRTPRSLASILCPYPYPYHRLLFPSPPVRGSSPPAWLWNSNQKNRQSIGRRRCGAACK